MKTKLLKKFRKRFEIVKSSKTRFMLLDKKNEKVISLKCNGGQITSFEEALYIGVHSIVSSSASASFIKNRNKRIFKSYIKQDK